MAAEQSWCLLQPSQDRTAQTQGLNGWAQVTEAASEHQWANATSPKSSLPARIQHLHSSRKKKKDLVIPETSILWNLRFPFLKEELSSYETFRRTRHLNVHRLFPEMADRFPAQLLQALCIQNIVSSAPVQWPSEMDTTITLRGPDRAPDSCPTQRLGISANHNRRSSHFVLHFVSSSLFKNLSGLVSCYQTGQFCTIPACLTHLSSPEGDTYHRGQL